MCSRPDDSAARAAHFEALYAASDDPWHYESAAMERHKRVVIGRLLGPGRHPRGIEIGCGPGVATRQLAAHFLHLTAVDGARGALAHAARRTAHLDNVSLVHGRLPLALPHGCMDAAIASEVLYYLAEAERRATIAGLRAALRPGGRLVVVNTTGRYHDMTCDGARIRREVRVRFGRPCARISTRHFIAEAYRKPPAQAER